jgi:predicted GTPase
MAVGEDWSVAVCTKKIDFTVVDLHDSPQHNRLVLVDTPGFNNYDKPDADVVQDILTWLERKYAIVTF